MPLALIHKITVLAGFLLVQQPHGSAPPNFADPPARMAVEHEASSVKTLHGTNIAGPSIDRLFAVRRECCRGGHGKSKQTVLAVVDKPVLGTVIAIGIPPASGVPIEMYQRIVQRLVGHLRTAFFGQQQKGEHVRTGSVEVAVAVTRRDPAPP